MSTKKITEFSAKLSALEVEWEAIKKDIDLRIEKLKNEVKATHKKPAPVKASKAEPQSGNFPYPVGQVVQVAFPELFKRKLLNAGDIAYLLSKKASVDFKTRGHPVLKIYVGEDDPDLYSAKHRRYYKMPPLELGSKKYHLSSQFFPKSREPVLKWIYNRGLHRDELIEAIRNSIV